MGSPTVLIVDDDPSHRDISGTVLRHHGYRVLEADDGERAIQLALDEHPSVILMDVRLPILDGWKATERLKRDPRTAHIPVIVFTAQAMEQDRCRADEVGADSYLSKPCAPKRIVAEIRRWIGPGRETEDERSSTGE